MPLEFAQLSSSALLLLDPAKTIFFFPVGALEDHGPHLPMDLDLLEAQALCKLAGERLEHELPEWKACLMPVAPLSLDLNTGSIALGVRGHVLRDYLVDSCKSLVRAGFRHFVCFTGTASPKTLTAIEDAGRMISRRRRWNRAAGSIELVSALSSLTTLPEMLKAPFYLEPREHGGARDTSVALFLGAPVDPSYIGLIHREPPPSGWAAAWQRIRGTRSGYWGNPAQATPDLGRQALQETVDAVFPKLRAVWEGARPQALFRSWYSILPPNKSFFKAWLLVAAFAAVVMSWLYMVSKGFNGG